MHSSYWICNAVAWSLRGNTWDKFRAGLSTLLAWRSSESCSTRFERLFAARLAWAQGRGGSSNSSELRRRGPCAAACPWRRIRRARAAAHDALKRFGYPIASAAPGQACGSARNRRRSARLSGDPFPGNGGRCIPGSGNLRRREIGAVAKRKHVKSTGLWPSRSRRGPHRAAARVLPGPARLPAVRMPSTVRLPYERAGAFRSLVLAARSDSRRRCRGTLRGGSHGYPQLDVGDALAEDLRHRVSRSGLDQRHDALFFETGWHLGRRRGVRNGGAPVRSSASPRPRGSRRQRARRLRPPPPPAQVQPGHHVVHLRAIGVISRRLFILRIEEDELFGARRWLAVLILARPREAREIGVNLAAVRLTVDLEDPLSLVEGLALFVDLAAGAVEAFVRFDGRDLDQVATDRSPPSGRS